MTTYGEKRKQQIPRAANQFLAETGDFAAARGMTVLGCVSSVARPMPLGNVPTQIALIYFGVRSKQAFTRSSRINAQIGVTGRLFFLTSFCRAFTTI
jgi:hypothetical protein